MDFVFFLRTRAQAACCHITETTLPLSRRGLWEYLSLNRSSPCRSLSLTILPLTSGHLKRLYLFWSLHEELTQKVSLCDSCCDRASETLTKERDETIRRRFTDTEKPSSTVLKLCSIRSWSVCMCVGVCVLYCREKNSDYTEPLRKLSTSLR